MPYKIKLIGGKELSIPKWSEMTWGNITSKPATFTPASHTHDDRYYTEGETNNLLNGKSNTNHTHSYLPLAGGTITGSLTVNGNLVIGGETKHGGSIYDDGNYAMQMGVNNNHGLVQIYQAAGSTTGRKWWSPCTNGAVQLGDSGSRWGQIYSTSTSISTSDRNLKKDFKPFDERYERLFLELKPQLFKMKEGTSDRIHSGFISQDVEESLIQNGLTALDFAGFCKDRKKRLIRIDEDTHEMIEEDVIDDDGNLVYEYSLRYGEFIALNTHMIQKLFQKIEDLQNELDELKRAVGGRVKETNI